MSIMQVRGVTTPCDDDRIWRYMGFTKFASMLLGRALFFSRIDRFADRCEGVLPEQVRLQYGSSMQDWFAKNKARMFVSCWHLNTVESVLMWKAYSGGEHLVAIESHVGAVRGLLNGLDDAYVIGCVQYVDFDRDKYKGVMGDDINIVIPAYYKRQFYRTEQEFRILLNPFSTRAINAMKAEETGMEVPLDLNRLIDQVCLPPDTAPWFSNLVRGLCQQLGLNKKVVPSAV